MKVLVVLVLAVFAGCNASFFQADAPSPQMDMLVDAFWEYVAQATRTADDAMQTIRKSQFGQDIDARLSENTALASKYFASVQEQIPPETKAMITQAQTEIEQFKQSAVRELNSVKEKVEPLVEQMKVGLLEKFEQFKVEMLTFAESRGLIATVTKRFEEMKTTVEQTGKELQVHLEPFTEEARTKFEQHAEDLKQSMAPMVQGVQAELTKKFTEAKDMATPYVDEAREKLDPYATDLQARLLGLMDSFSRAQ